MEERDILIETLQEDGREPTAEQVDRLDSDLTKLAQILFDYVISQKRRGGKISDPYPGDDTSDEGSPILSSVDERTS